ncbi:MAG: sigma-70 family RNA polymerase sigma factor [Candidatus Doudnabacteria bacterium]|nr:sigma-70 family RNA polymerase sigma factor [Candidatus Doudnabacteria bacterium]
MDINDLIKRVQQGDSEAFGQVYDIFAQRIFKYIRLKVQNKEQAEDILQEVFIKAYKGIAALKLEGLNFNAWLYRVASNTVNDHFRKKYRTPEILNIDDHQDISSSSSPQKDMEFRSEMSTVLAAFEDLSPIYRQVLELRFLQDLTIKETAHILSKSQLAIRLLQHRALKKVEGIISRTTQQ